MKNNYPPRMRSDAEVCQRMDRRGLCVLQGERKDFNLSWIIHKIFVTNPYPYEYQKVAVENRTENNPGNPGLLKEKING
jgi:hypothetical protein